MAQRVRRQRNRNKVKGVAVKKNSNSNTNRKTTVRYGNVQIVTYGKSKNKKGKKK